MVNERLEALIGEYSDLQRDQWRLDARRALLESKLDPYFSKGVPAQERQSLEGSLVRVEHTETFIDVEHAPEVLEALREQAYEYFRVSVLMYPNEKCLSLLSQRYHPMRDLLLNKLKVRQHVRFDFIPASDIHNMRSV